MRLGHRSRPKRLTPIGDALTGKVQVRHQMDDTSSSQSVNTFVIRVWCEPSLGAPRWRGRIQHLQSGQHAAFQDPERILTFIRASGAFAGDQYSDVADQTSEAHDA